MTDCSAKYDRRSQSHSSERTPHRECHVSAVYIFNSGEITANAKEQLLSELERERYGDNVHFLDGERLDALNEWGTLQSDTTARARLLGLRSALRFIIHVLEEYLVKGQEKNLHPTFVQGIELYLSEPVNCDDQLLVLLYRLWQMLQMIDGVRKLAMPLSKNAEKLVTTVQKHSQNALSLAKEACQKVEAVIEKMKPIGGS